MISTVDVSVIRAKRGFSQCVLSTLAKVSRETIIRVEKTGYASAKTAAAIAKVLDLDIQKDGRRYFLSVDVLKDNTREGKYTMQHCPTIYEYEGKDVRTITIDNKPWFVAKDVCGILKISNRSDAVSRLDEDERSNVSLTDGGQKCNFIIVSESGLYSLILGSRKPEAKQFKRWITNNVLPALRMERW